MRIGGRGVHTPTPISRHSNCKYQNVCMLLSPHRCRARRGWNGGGYGTGENLPREEMERNRLKSQIKTNKNRRADEEIRGVGG